MSTESSLIQRARRSVGERPRPLPAAVAGLGFVAVVGAVSVGVENNLASAPKALALMLPVIFTAMTGGRRASAVVAVVAALTFGFVVPPYASASVAFRQDVVALVVFSIVAALVSAIVARRVELLGELDRQRSLLLRSVSHDFRTPLAVIRAAATELSEDGDHTPAVRGRLLQLIEAETNRLDRLVANVLDLSRIESGSLRARRDDVDLGELFDTCARRLGHAFDAVRLTVVVEPDARVVPGDHLLLEQLVTNLLENAARHSPAGGRVELMARRRGDRVAIVVADQGPGVPPDLRPVVFDVFRSAGTAAGSGVGLAICRAVAEAHGGSIALGTSRWDGAEFTVLLPTGGRSGGR